MTDNLKSCPFCGGEAEEDIYGTAYCPDGLSGADNENKKCYNDVILSIVDWNTRPIEDRKSREIAELRDKYLAQAAEIERQKEWNVKLSQSNISLSQELVTQAAEIERLRHALSQQTARADLEMSNALGAQAEIDRLNAVLDKIIAIPAYWEESAIDEVQALARAAREKREAANE